MKTTYKLAVLALFIVNLPTIAAEKPHLTVYTYDSFIADWGPGPRIKAAFEAQCSCIIDYVAADSSTGILNRIRLEGESSKADIVLGLDATQMNQVKQTGLLAPHQINTQDIELPTKWQEDVFVPFDFGYFAFIYDARKLKNPPTSLQALANSDYKIIIQDPRSSTTGLGLLLWLQSVMGDQAKNYWPTLADNVVTVTKGWSEAYGLFLEGEADMVLSYTTSPAYHLINDKKAYYQAAPFKDGHGLQIEVAARLKKSAHPKLAKQFLQFILSSSFQSIIPTGNWMFPVVKKDVQLPKEFAQLIDPSSAHFLNSQQVTQHKKQWLDDFLHGMSQ